MKKTFDLDGLDCANCAAKLEKAIAGISGVDAASVDFMGRRLVLEAAEGDFDAIVHSTRAVIAKTEPDITLHARQSAAAKPGRVSAEGTADSRALRQSAAASSGDATAIGGGHCHEGCADCDGHSHSHEGCEGCIVGHGEQDNEREAALGKPEAPRGVERDAYLSNQIIRIAGCIIILIAVNVLPQITLFTEVAMYLIAYLLIGADIIWKAIRNILRGKVFDENFLMSIATIGAFLINDYAEGVAVMLFYQVGELFQHYAVNRSRKSITGLMNIKPDFANVLVNGELIKGAPEDVEIGDIVLVKPGEKIPLDGKIIEGVSTLDTAALTGEALPREAAVGDEALSGCINLTGPLHIRVTREFGQSTVSKILELVENSSSKKASAESFITRFAAIYTPVVVGVAVLLAVLPPLFFGGLWHDWLYRALSFLVVSCPCALVISIPLGIFGGIGGASRQGVLIKGGNYLEALASTKIVVFDKTGTLTQGRFFVTEVKPVDDNCPIIELIAHAELYSNHPISLSVKAAYGSEPQSERVTETEELSGRGIRAVVDGKTLLAGNERLMRESGLTAAQSGSIGTAVHLAIDGVYAGYVIISDKIKPDAGAALAALKACGVKKTVMLTGDSKAVGAAVGAELGIDEVYAELLPADKVERLEELLAQKQPKSTLAFVGDGINDAPVLARADIGIAMGGLGSDAAIEAADIVLMTDEPSRIATAIKISRRTLGIIKQNIAFALIVKVFVLVLVAFGLSTMWEAVFADVGVSVIAILNSTRALRVKKLR